MIELAGNRAEPSPRWGARGAPVSARRRRSGAVSAAIAASVTMAGAPGAASPRSIAWVVNRLIMHVPVEMLVRACVDQVFKIAILELN